MFVDSVSCGRSLRAPREFRERTWEAPVPAPLGIYGLDSENVAETNAANNAPYPMQELEEGGLQWLHCEETNSGWL